LLHRLFHSPIFRIAAVRKFKIRHYAPLLLGLGFLLSLPTRPTSLHAQSGVCGPFTDVSGSDVFCPFILQAFNLGITNGTGSGTTFSPDQTVPRNQMVAFFDRAVDFTLHRGRRTAIGRTWAATSTAGGVSQDVGGAVVDLVSDGRFLWVARNDGAILKVNESDRRVLETWRISSNAPRSLGVFAGLVWIVDNVGNLYFFNPSESPSTRSPLFTNAVTGGFPILAFDGTFVWVVSSASQNIFIYQVSSPTGNAVGPFGANVLSVKFDGTFMWMLLANGHLQKRSPVPAGGVPALVEDITLPASVSDSRMAWDGNNLWIPSGGSGRVMVVRPAQGSFPSQVVLNQVLAANFPYAAAFDGETIMIGDVNDGVVNLFKASNLAFIRTFNTGAGSVRGISSDGLTFSVGDATGSKFFQF